MTAGADMGQEMWLWKPANVSSYFCSGGVNPSISFLPEWQNQTPEYSPVLGSLPPRALLNRYAGQRPGRKWAQQGSCALPLRRTPVYSHLTAECKNSKAPDAFFFILKTGSELLGAPFVVLCASGIITNHTWEAAFPPADGSRHSMSLEATGTASLRVMALAPLQLKTLLLQDASLLTLFHEILFYLKVWVSTSSDSCLKSHH